MRITGTYIFLAAIMAVLISVISSANESAIFSVGSAEQRGYVCPPCTCGQDHVVKDAPGTCDACGMALIEQASQTSQPASPAPQPERKRAAILVFDGVQIIDYTGPYEVFGQAGFNVYTVAASAAPITTAMGMRIVPSYSLENSPPPHVIVIPGGEVGATQNDAKVIQWIQENSKNAEHVLSVCNGAFILAKTGLLDGLAATTFYDLIDGLAALAPRTKIVTDQRYVDNGKIITTAGISSGIDGSLYVVSKMMGKARAQMAALNMEYNWQPDSRYARASFADVHIRRIFSRWLRLSVPQGAEHRVLSTEGGTDHWQVEWLVKSQAPASEIIKSINARLEAGKWAAQPAGKNGGAAESSWRFTDDKGATWKGAVTVKPAAGERDAYSVVIKINRAQGA